MIENKTGHMVLGTVGGKHCLDHTSTAWKMFPVPSQMIVLPKG